MSGSSSVRNSSFGLVGFTSITPATLRRQQWSLENVPLVSPIEGSLELKIQCHTESLIEERGFLTVFEDVAGFGAWHRRWCLLSNDRLLFWKYPDDEKRKVLESSSTTIIFSRILIESVVQHPRIREKESKRIQYD